ncbi:MAG: hypothetical protein ACE5I7_08330 [Candidatus Binatia bacterium]
MTGRVRACAAVGLLAAFALFSAARTLRHAAPVLLRGRLPADRITMNEGRFAALRTALAGHGVVGYLSPLPPDKLASSVQGIAQFYLTQYALAPVIVVNDPTQRFVVANFFGRAAPPARVHRPHLVTVHDFGGGVILLERTDP